MTDETRREGNGRAAPPAFAGGGGEVCADHVDDVSGVHVGHFKGGKVSAAGVLCGGKAVGEALTGQRRDKEARASYLGNKSGSRGRARMLLGDGYKQGSKGEQTLE